jgi:hypothetical protein
MWADPDTEGDVWVNPDAAADKLADLDRDLLQLLAQHHRARQVANGVVFRAAMRLQRGG